MNIAYLLARAGRGFADRPALWHGDRLVADYGALARRAATIAGNLRARYRLAPGDRAALVMKNCPDYLEAWYGVWHAGLTAVPVNAKLHPKELAYILDHSGSRICFVTEDLAEAVAPLVHEVPRLERMVVVGSTEWHQLAEGDAADLTERTPDDVAWLFYTSGTTGRPKGAMLTHRNLYNASWAFLTDVDTVGPEDALLHAAPLSHGSGLYASAHVARAASQVIAPSGGFDPAEILEMFRLHKGVAMFAAPTMVKRLVDYPATRSAPTPGLKTIIYGGGPMYVADLKQALATLGNRFAQIYGQGESPMTITRLDKRAHGDVDHPRYEERLGSAGVPYAIVEVRVVDGEDRDLPPGEIGEILARGDTVMRGYWENPEATAKTLAGGWLHTGDVGSFDADGYLTLRDRSKDLIISGGSNIYPREVEEVLLRHPEVSECSVVGRPHPEWGEEVVAFVVRAPGSAVAPAALDQLCLDHIARFKRPKDYRFVDALPKNNYGKVLKTELRTLLTPST
jgi:long-chain acyl-CoA synthetase